MTVSRYVLVLVIAVCLGVDLIWERTCLRQLAYEIRDLQQERDQLREHKERLRLHVRRLSSQKRLKRLVAEMNLDLVPAYEWQVCALIEGNRTQGSGDARQLAKQGNQRSAALRGSHGVFRGEPHRIRARSGSDAASSIRTGAREQSPAVSSTWP